MTDEEIAERYISGLYLDHNCPTCHGTSESVLIEIFIGGMKYERTRVDREHVPAKNVKEKI